VCVCISVLDEAAAGIDVLFVGSKWAGINVLFVGSEEARAQPEHEHLSLGDMCTGWIGFIRHFNCSLLVTLIGPSGSSMSYPPPTKESTSIHSPPK